MGTEAAWLQAPKAAVGDGALGFWAALEEVFPQTQTQRCWVHKTANVLNYLPKSLQAKAKGSLQAIWMAETRAQANKAFNAFLTPGDKWPQGTLRLAGGASRVPGQGAPRWPDLHLGLLHRDRQWTLWLTVAPAKMERADRAQRHRSRLERGNVIGQRRRGR